MGLFSKNTSTNDPPALFDKNYAGFRTKVYATHIECRDQRGTKRNIPISQVSNVGLPVLIKQVEIETTGGERIKVAVYDRKGFRDAVMQAMNSRDQLGGIATVLSDADELKKYADLLASGAITQEEYIAKKHQILG